MLIVVCREPRNTMFVGGCMILSPSGINCNSFVHAECGIRPCVSRSSSSHSVFFKSEQHREAALRVVGAKAEAKSSNMEKGKREVELVHPGYTGPSVKVPLLGLGVWQASPAECEKAVEFALRNGYRHIDTASLYQNERAVGKGVRASGIPREEIFVTTKLWNSDQGYQQTLRAFDRSLKELGLEYVDLYLVHSPLSPDRLKTWKAMEEILLSGKARAIGVSNYGIHHLQELFDSCRIRPSVNQIELSPFCGRQRLVQFCKSQNIVLQAYSPLTRGKNLNHPVLVQIAKKYNKSSAQLLIRWCIEKEYVTLPKSVTPSRIIENSQVFDFEISPQDMQQLDALDENLITGWDPTTSR